MDIEELKRKLRRKTRKDRQGLNPNKQLSSGSTLLNLACSGHWKWAFYRGGYSLLVGDSDSGKSMLTMTVFAEAANNAHFDDYILIHDNAEHGVLMDLEEFFGTNMAKRIKEPSLGTSEWVEDFYYNLDELYSQEKPFIYILDSMDSIDSKQDYKAFKKQRAAREQGKDAGGDYKLAKPRLNSEGLRKAMANLPKTGSILIIVSQTRDAINRMPFGPEKTRSGGRALKFYARLEIWTSVMKTLSKEIRGIKHQIGIQCKINIRKNHITGAKHSVQFPIYNSYGIDDVGSCIDYLLANGVWKKQGNTINANDLELKGTRKVLIESIEEEGLENELRKLTARTWQCIKEQTRIDRKKRYE